MTISLEFSEEDIKEIEDAIHYDMDDSYTFHVGNMVVEKYKKSRH